MQHFIESRVTPAVKSSSTWSKTMTNPQTKPQTAEIKCINKRDRPNPHERITHVGGFGNSRWKLAQKDAIDKIDRGEWSFYVALPGTNKSVWVEVATSRFGNKYLRTQGDDETRNNLLSLPECP
ncbi:DUF3892 domain-containing protein [Bradyrhizobium sp.]|jgi:hypothetical protein|uniref:DUF3892 domain-containing protein n=1 Tax=Bradyrhizobium sp. TaxID=376 RepID=UPI003C671526